MDMLAIRGGIPLRGTVSVSGAKNAALPIMAAALLTDAPVRLLGVPRLADVATLSQVLRCLGMQVDAGGEGELTLTVTDRDSFTAPYDLVRKMRASICVLGPLLGRRGRARVSLPGGCNIGNRPIDLHLKGLAAMGANIRVENGYVVASARRLKGAVVDLLGPQGVTVTGTCNILTAAVLADGVTTITNAALEPEVVDLGEFLNRLGARIEGLGTSTIRIEGVPALGGGIHRVIPDRIEAGTFLMAAAASRGEVQVTGLRQKHLTSVAGVLREAGVELEFDAAGRAATVAARGMLRPLSVTAVPYPGMPTDLQAQLTALLTLAGGESVITDDVFPSRFMHVSELCRMGARIDQRGNCAVIQGGSTLTGASVMASDLRASAALMIAGIAAKGETTIRRVYHLDRGYEGLDRKLASLGADVRRLRDDAGVPSVAPASKAA